MTSIPSFLYAISPLSITIDLTSKIDSRDLIESKDSFTKSVDKISPK